MQRHARSAPGISNSPRVMRWRNTQYVHVWYSRTSGTKTAATMVMTVSVYAVDDALVMVRL